jgi:hypothetical protein
MRKLTNSLPTSKILSLEDDEVTKHLLRFNIKVNYQLHAYNQTDRAPIKSNKYDMNKTYILPSCRNIRLLQINFPVFDS